MSFPRYERYKDSGVQWLGEVPEHWDLRKLGSVAAFKGGGTPAKDNLEFWNGDIPWVSPKDMKGESIEASEDGITQAGLASGATSLIPAGAVLIVVRSGILKHTIPVAINRIPVTLNQDMKAILINPSVSLSAFFLRWVQGLNELLLSVWLKQGATVESVEHLYISNTDVPFPPLYEQEIICRFLEIETGKIDSLIEEQQRLIDLLKEKRQAVISQAVTKGLHPDTDRKSWKLKHLITSIEQGWSPQCDNNPAEDGEWAVLKVGSVNHGCFNPNENKALPLDVPPVPSLGIAKDDVLISRANTRELVGSAAVAELDYPRHLLCDKIYRLKVRANVCLAKYICRFLGTPEIRTFIEASATGASQSMVNIGQDVIRKLPILLPTPSEQKEIVAYIETQDEALAALAREATRAIELLRERRSTLISAAVTGKIDVRSFVAKPVMGVTQFTPGFARQLLAAEILDRCNGQRMGRVKLQKLIHLCEYHGQVGEVKGDYSRKAAGPFDARAMAGISKNLKKQRWFEEVREGERYVYRPLEKRGEHKKYLAHWEAEMPRIDEVLSLLGQFKTRECEIVSTLYAAWNDLLIDRGSAEDAAILHEASSAERWHKSKEEIAPERWKRALQWMKGKGLVPAGYGNTRDTLLPDRKRP